MPERIIFISRNPYKFEEIKPLLEARGVAVAHLKKDIKELQSDNLQEIVRQKTIDAFRLVGRPVIVEHTGLFIEALSNMPGGLTQLFWDSLRGDGFCKMLQGFECKNAIARTLVGYCDGRRLHTDQFVGELRGTITDRPRGDRQFQWGTIFVPQGTTRTYCELSVAEVNLISHRFKAFTKFLQYWSPDKS